MTVMDDCAFEMVMDYSSKKRKSGHGTRRRFSNMGKFSSSSKNTTGNASDCSDETTDESTDEENIEAIKQHLANSELLRRVPNFVSRPFEVAKAQAATAALVVFLFAVWIFFAYLIFSPASFTEPAEHHAVKRIHDRANKQTIYGSVAGLVISIVTLCGGVGLNLRFEKVLIMGIASLLANGAALSVGEYITVSTREDFIQAQITRGSSEILSTRTEEIARLIRHYENIQGLDANSASTLAHTLANITNTNGIWADTLLHAEFGLMPSCIGPVYAATSVFVSFVYFGMLPYIGIVASALLRFHRRSLFAPQSSVLLSIVISLVVLFVYGHESAQMRKSQNSLFIGFLMMSAGLVAVTLSIVGTFLVPRGVSKLKTPKLTPPMASRTLPTAPLLCSSPTSDYQGDGSVEAFWPLLQEPLCKGLLLIWICIGAGLTLSACIQYAVVFAYGLFTCVVTGLGVVPLYFFDALHPDVSALANSLAGGTMMAASLGLIVESIATSGQLWWQLWLGLASGVGFVVISQMFVHEEPAEILAGVAEEKKDATKMNKMLLFVTVMFVHSIAEGVACGVSFERNDSFGRYVAFALAAHNIPEGLAIALVLVPQGFSKRTTTLVAIMSSAPQPLLAAISVLFVDSMKYMLPVGLAFAAGAMIYVAVTELGLPSLQHLGMQKFGLSSSAAAICMFALQAWIQAIV